MKQSHLRVTVLLLVAIFVATGFSFNERIDLSHYKLEGVALCYTVPNEFELVSETTLPMSYNLFLGKTYVGFKEALGFKESRGNYSIINQFGYMGKYQFGKSTLHMIGIKNSEQFLEDTFLQEKAFTAYTARNKWILRKDIKRYNGRHIGGVKITESGILAAAHLAGAGNVKKFLRSGGEQRFEDANGTSIRYYLKKFSGYDTSHIVASRKAKVK
ncbi:MAG: peptidoglycan-binding protein LysM [Altibacter sp.]|uniref:peptidoglycan-binding protein LysM n=1 Tax=Altibacter sp. TaxID=2024823 RepID=UPI001E1A1311|nr:peptidoglycan-binding protein LysM [Altibacter sp.]MBZ0326057.1 peptidoglycan-binding protein LysM [Altibacter sp.]